LNIQPAVCSLRIHESKCQTVFIKFSIKCHAHQKNMQIMFEMFRWFLKKHFCADTNKSYLILCMTHSELEEAVLWLKVEVTHMYS